MPVIGVAEVLIRPSFRGVQQSVGRELDGISSTEGTRAGTSMGQKLGGALKVGALAAGGAVIGGLGLALTKGFGRLQAIENAKAKLTGLGHTADAVAGIMKNATAAVSGTAFGLDEAATVAATAVAAGVKPGKDLERTLKLTGDAATIAGVGMAEMGSIFNKVASSNKIQGEVIAQLSDAGIPIVQLLGKELGKTAEETLKLASDGKINFETFQKAMEQGMGGAALESGKTLQGAFKNTMAAVGRIGANLLSGVYPKIQEFFSSAIGWLKPLEESAKVAGAAVGDFLNDGLSAAKGITDILFKGDFTGGIFGIEEDSKLVDYLFKIRESVQNVASFLKTDLIPALKDFGGWIVDNKDWLSAIGVTIGTIAVGFKAWTTALAAWKAITTAAIAIQAAFNVVMAMNPIGLIVLAVAGLVAGLVYFFTQTETGKKIVEVAFAAIKNAVAAVVDWWNGTLIPALQSVGQWFKDVWDGAAKAVQVAVDWVQDAIANVIDWISNNWGLLLTIILGPLGYIIQWVVKNWTQISDTVKAVFGAVAEAFTWVYETIIKPVFDSIMVVANGFYLGFRGIFQLVVAIFKEIILPAFMDFWHGIVEPIFNGIKDFFVLWWEGVKLIFTSVVDFVKTVFSAVWTWLRDSVITPVFNFIVGYIGWWWATVSGIFNAVIGFIRTVFSAAFTWLRDGVITPVFNFIKNAITVWWTGVKFIFDTVVGFVRNTLATVFTWLRDTIIAPVFNGIRDTIRNVWERGIKPVFDTLTGAVRDGLPKAFQTAKDAIARIWDGIKEIAKAPIRFVLKTVIDDGLIGGFNKIASILPGIDKLPTVTPNGFRDGGYTGDLGYGTIAGVVHGNEHVIRAESRKAIEMRAPGLLDSLNRYGAAALEKFGYRKGGRVNPTKHMGLTQGYHGGHDGIDIGVPTGTPVFATGPGTVNWAGPGVQLPGIWGGNEIHILGDGFERWFGHLSQIGVQLGQKVAAGQQIGLSGNTGITSGPHLHFGVYSGGYPNSVNPLSYLAGASSPKGGGGFLDPLGAISGLAGKIVGQLKGAFPMGGFMVDAAAGMGKKMFTSVIDWAKGKLGMGATAGPQGAHLNPILYDQGGVLRPGLSSIMNATGKPEAIYTNEQDRALQALAARGAQQQQQGRGDVIFKGNVGWDPHEIANRIDNKRRDTFAAYGI